MTLWKIYTMEDEFPGLWQQWYRHQCVAVGWVPHWFKLRVEIVAYRLKVNFAGSSGG